MLHLGGRGVLRLGKLGLQLLQTLQVDHLAEGLVQVDILILGVLHQEFWLILEELRRCVASLQQLL